VSAPIFISYASADGQVAETLCDALQTRGYGCWIACRDVMPGENFQEAIVRAIRSAKIMLLVFTGNANNSDEIKKEVVLAGRYRVPVVPVRVEDVVPNDALAYEFATRQWIDLFKDWERSIDRLASLIGNMLASSGTESKIAADSAPQPGSKISFPPAAKPASPRRTVVFGALALVVFGFASAHLYRWVVEPASETAPPSTAKPPASPSASAAAPLASSAAAVPPVSSTAAPTVSSTAVASSADADTKRVAAQPPADPLRRDLVTDCDRLAASPVDSERPEGVAGIDVTRIDIVPALAACNDAVNKYPNVARFAFQLGRVAYAQQDFTVARRWFEKAAAAGNTYAMNNLGALYGNGQSVSQDYGEARRWYEKAAAAGNAVAMNNLGGLYADGQGVSQDYGEARDWYKKAAAAGNALAMSGLGLLYANGQGVSQDYSEARRWFEKAAAADDSAGMTNLGWLYENGKGAPQDYGEARRWYEKAAAAGSGTAMANLGILCENGNGAPQDYAKARSWYEKAVAAGNAKAMTYLGDLYRDGHGVAKSIDDARKWYQKAIAAGDTTAKDRLANLK
jgi:TPR repeat protein